jgi:urocanate hydratase
VDQRIADGYILRENVYTDLEACIHHLENARLAKEVITLIYHGNVVDLLEYFVENNVKIELGSDQTSLHNIDDMGYTPVGYSFEEAKKLMLSDRIGFKSAVEKSLIRHVKAVNALTSKGMYFWDYGNAFLKEAGKAGADVFAQGSDVKYRYPSYVEDIMGPLCFDYGFGPFRWVCTSALQEDLDLTDKIAESVILELIKSADNDIIPQLNDNLQWIRNAKEQIPVVGSKSRILYADAEGRIAIAKAFNNAINQGALSGPVVLGRDHHDVSGTDSPYRETSNIYDGSSFTADMAVHNVIGDSFRGATWVSIHNGGGVGWGEVINGGFGMVLDGSDDAERRLTSMLHWDVYNGIARRSWARNEHAIDTIKKAKVRYPNMMITEVNLVDKSILDGI